MNSIPEHFRSEYIFIEKIDTSSMLGKHITCGREGRYEYSNFKKEIPCALCRKEAKLDKVLAEKYPSYKRIGENSVIHNRCQHEFELPPHWKMKSDQNLCKKCSLADRKVRTSERNKQRVHNETNGEYELLGFVESFTTPVLVRHNAECNHEFPVTMNDFLNKGTRCPVCMKHLVTEEMYLERLSEVRSDVVLMSKFIGMSKPIEFLHKPCNQKNSKPAKYLLSKWNPCSYCTNRITELEVMNAKINELTNGEYSVLEYETASKYALFYHHACETKYEKEPSVFINKGHRCPVCANGGRKRNKGEIIKGSKAVTFKEKVESRFPNYECINENTIKHKACGLEIPFNWKKDAARKEINLCPDCKPVKAKLPVSEKRKRDNQIEEKELINWQERQEQRILTLTNGEYSLVSEFLGNRKQATFKHNVEGCGNEFTLQFHSFATKGSRCPDCTNKRPSEKQYWEQFKGLFGEDFELVSEFKGLTKEITILHKTCNTLLTNKAYQFLKNKQPCGHCKKLNSEHKKELRQKAKKEKAANQPKKEPINWQERQEQRILTLTDGEYSLVSEFLGIKKDATFKHNVEGCGKEFTMQFRTFASKGSRCPDCEGKRLNQKQYWEKFESLHGEEFELVSEYNGISKEIAILHHTCETTTTNKASAFLNKKYACKHCKKNK